MYWFRKKSHIKKIMYLTFDLAVTLNLKATIHNKFNSSRPFEWYMTRCILSASFEDKRGGAKFPPSGARSGKDPIGARDNRSSLKENPLALSTQHAKCWKQLGQKSNCGRTSYERRTIAPLMSTGFLEIGFAK